MNHPAFARFERYARPDGSFEKVDTIRGEEIWLRSSIISNGQEVSVAIGKKGPRGGFYPLSLSGTWSYLSDLVPIARAARDFAEELELARANWLEEEAR